MIIASEWPVPYFLICSIASSTFLTTLADIIRSSYSVPQSSSDAGTAPALTNISSPLISTFFYLSSFIIIGINFSAIFSCTRRLSHELHTPGRCVFALRTILTAFSRSAVSSTYT